MRRIAHILIGAGLCAAVLALVRVHDAPKADSGESAAARRPIEAGVEMDGNVRGLYPGATKSLRLRFGNHHGFALRVDAIRIEVTSDGSECPADSLDIGPVRPPEKKLPPTSRRTAEAKVTMRRTAPDICQGARIPLVFDAHAHRKRDR